MTHKDLRLLALDSLRRTGTALVLRRGPEVSVDDIVRSAGCSKGAFYYHFNSKRDFLMEVLAPLSLAALTPAELARLLPLVSGDPELRTVLANPAHPRALEERLALEDAMSLGRRLMSLIEVSSTPGPRALT